MNKINIRVLLGFLMSVVVFHFFIVTKLIPYDIAWGGRIQNDQEMYVFEALSIIVNLFLALILLMKGNYMKPIFSDRTLNTILWIYFGMFILNTVGNIFAKTNLEKSFAALTLLFSVLIWNILRNQGNRDMLPVGKKEI